MSTSIPYNRGGGAALTPNWAKRLTFTGAPAAMEFGLEIGTGADPLVFRGDVDAQALQTLLEACSDLAGYGVQVFGRPEQSGTGDDGVPRYTGNFIVILSGAAPYPVWSAVQNGEVQSLAVEEGEVPTEAAAERYVVSGAGATGYNGDYFHEGTHNGKSLWKKDDGHYLYFDTYDFGEGDCWILHSFVSTSPGQINQPGQEPDYAVYTSADSPPSGGWETVNGSSPAPASVVYVGASAGGGQYTLNGGSDFVLGVSEADLQVNQRGLGGNYSDVDVKGLSFIGNAVTISGAGSVEWNGTYYDKGNTYNTLPVFEKDANHLLWADTSGVTEWKLAATAGGAPLYGAPGDGTGPTGTWVTTITGTNPAPVSVIEALAIARFSSYFPFTAGNVAAPAATGTNATVSTLYEGGGASELVTCTDADLDALLIGGLQNPAGSGAPAPFTPNGDRWYDPDPTTTAEAINRMAAMFYNWMLDAIP